jgi:hypothetical protein
VTAKPLLVGEDNPLSRDPRHALYPYPKHHAGGRLALAIMGLTVMEYLRKFDRVNLCKKKWSIKEARGTATYLLERRDLDRVVLLGAKVCAAFGFEFEPFRSWKTPCGSRRYVILPHPSGRCRIWNDPDSIERARAAMREAGAL